MILLAFIRKHLMSIMAIVGLGYVIYGIYHIGYVQGSNAVQQQWTDAKFKLAKETIQRQNASAAITDKVTHEYVTRIQLVQARQRVLIKEVPRYVTPRADTQCVITNGFRMHWNTANQSLLPDPSVSPDAAPGTTELYDTPIQIRLSDVATQHAAEASRCQATEEQLIQLQLWLTAQQAIP